MEKNAWTPAELLQLSGGYWSACALHAGVKLDVFTPLAERPLKPGNWPVSSRPISVVLPCC